jgi:hypothetical protein
MGPQIVVTVSKNPSRFYSSQAFETSFKSSNEIAMPKKRAPLPADFPVYLNRRLNHGISFPPLK